MTSSETSLYMCMHHSVSQLSISVNFTVVILPLTSSVRGYHIQGVEVVVDDFVVVGFGDTLEDAVRDHDHNLEAFLQRCAARGIRLNSNKVQLKGGRCHSLGV